MMVEQYVAKFIELSHFAMYLIPNEARKAEKYERGLNQRILDHIIALRIRNFPELVDLATIIEQNFQVSMDWNNQTKRQVQQEGLVHNKRPYYNNGQRALQFNKPSPNASGQHTLCQTCSKVHFGKCLMGTGKFFKRRKPGHIAKDCSQVHNALGQAKNINQRGTTIARVFALTSRDIEASNDVVTGILPLFSWHASTLFDFGATHSFVSILMPDCVVRCLSL
jgi:hypothetical protein